MPEILSREWPRIEGALRRDLRRLVGPADVDDIVQLVFLRLVPRAAEFSPAHLRNRARRAARNLAYNLTRDRLAHAEPVGSLLDLPEVPAPYGVDEEYERAVDGRAVVERVREALDRCSPTERTALALHLAGAPGGANQDVRLHRARKRLRAALDGMLGAGPLWRLRRRIEDWAQPAAALGGTLAVTAVATVGGLAGPATVAVDTGGAPARVPVVVVERPAALPPPPSPSRHEGRAASVPPPAVPVRDRIVADLANPAGTGPAVVVGAGGRGDRKALVCTGTEGVALVGNLCINHPSR